MTMSPERLARSLMWLLLVAAVTVAGTEQEAGNQISRDILDGLAGR